MGQRTRTPASGVGNLVVNVTRTAGSSGNSHSDPSSSSWVLVAVALAIGYAMGSTTASNSWSLGLVWKAIALFEEWVRDVVVPCYTLSAFLYLLSQNYQEGRDDKPKDSKSLAALRSALSSFSLQLPPALRKWSSTSTASSEAQAETPPASSGKQEDEDHQEDEGDKPIDMTGVFKVVENDNFGEFLKAQGVPWFLCNAASKARPTHHFTHSSAQKLTIQIRGIIESETSYQIGGPHTETTIRGRVFQDSLSYLYDGTAGASDDDDGEPKMCCVGVQTRKIAVGEGYEVHVQRRIIRAGTTWTPTPDENPDGHCTYDLDAPCDFDRLLMTNKVVYEEGRDEESIIASQLFHRTD